MNTMHKAIVILSVMSASALAGCGEEPAVRSYETTLPVAYNWPVTQSREAQHKSELLGWSWAWTVPAGWVDAPEVPDLLVADYRLKGTTDDLPGRVTVSVIDGDGGGIMTNVNRWHQQLYVTTARGLGPRDIVSQPMPGPVGQITIVELTGQYQGPYVPTHLLGAIIQIAGPDGKVLQTWFFKMVGDQQTINDNRLTFTRLFLSFRPAGSAPIDLPDEFFVPEKPATQTPTAPQDDRPFLARPVEPAKPKADETAPAPTDGDRP